MKKCFSLFGLFSLIAFSFYFTDKVSNLAFKDNKIIKEIRSVQAFYNTKPSNAEINFKNSTIIPGKYGKKVNVRKSYLNMLDFDEFNLDYLVYSAVKPSISLVDNKDKYIISGNSYNRRVSIIIENNKKIKKLLDQKKIKYSVLLQNKVEGSNFINGATNITDFKLLNRYVRNNNRFCLKGYSTIELCKKYNYYLLSSNIILNSYNLIDVKSKIKSGSIILIKHDAVLDDVDLLLDDIKFKNLEIVTLSKLIDERE